MTDLATELLAFADDLSSYAAAADSDDVETPLSVIEEAAKTIGKAWSGSWLGYHANVYFTTLEPPPPGMHFSSEWGLSRSSEGWQEFDGDALEQGIRELAGSPDMTPVKAVADRAGAAFKAAKLDVTSLLIIAQEESSDSFIERLQDQLEALTIRSAAKVVRAIQPSGRVFSRDSVAIGQGLWTPPHIVVLAEATGLREPPIACRRLSDLCRRGGSHLRRRYRHMRKNSGLGTNVFIGHGRSFLWRDLKDFLADRLGLAWEEFNREPTAGLTTKERLEAMLEQASFAFLVMTGEDEHSDGSTHARANVVHEIGLFQGRLGFRRAIVLLEEGCVEFSNIIGLTQIRFPKGNIAAIFEEIRRVLEREGVLPAGADSEKRRRQVIEDIRRVSSELESLKDKAAASDRRGSLAEFAEEEIKPWKYRALKYLDANLLTDEVTPFADIRTSKDSAQPQTHFDTSCDLHLRFLNRLRAEIEADPEYPLKRKEEPSGNRLPQFGSFVYRNQ